MAQIFDPLPPDQSEQILCCYVNATNKIQIARITNISGWYFERVVFPGQRLIFEAVSQALLEIHCGMMASAILSDTIPCDRLHIQDVQDSQDSVLEPVSDLLDTVLNSSKAVQDPLAAATLTLTD